MGGGADHTKPRLDLGWLEVHRRYRVDWTNDRLRRTFRFTGTLLSVEVRPSTPAGGEGTRWLTFEVKPRFGRATVQRIDVATVRSIEPV